MLLSRMTVLAEVGLVSTLSCIVRFGFPYSAKRPSFFYIREWSSICKYLQRCSSLTLSWRLSLPGVGSVVMTALCEICSRQTVNHCVSGAVNQASQQQPSLCSHMTCVHILICVGALVKNQMKHCGSFHCRQKPDHVMINILTVCTKKDEKWDN